VRPVGGGPRRALGPLEALGRLAGAGQGRPQAGSRPEALNYVDVSRYIRIRSVSATPFTTLRQLIRRGSARLLVLDAVSSRPMHGYEVARRISATFEGTYVPRSGVIYPTLQWLEDAGYVVGSRLEDKTVYAITESGKGYLKRNEQSLKEIASEIQKRREEPEFSILRSAARLQRTIAAQLPEMSRGDKAQVAKILDEANRRVSRLIRA